MPLEPTVWAGREGLNECPPRCSGQHTGIRPYVVAELIRRVRQAKPGEGEIRWRRESTESETFLDGTWRVADPARQRVAASRKRVLRCSDASCTSCRCKSCRWNRPVATVVIPSGAKGDRRVGSLGVKVSAREASNSTGRSNGEPVSPEIAIVESAERYARARRPESS